MSVRVISQLYLFRKTIIIIITPLILLPLLTVAPLGSFEASACAFSILLMATYWVTEVVPLAVTALLPLVLYPFLGILPASTVSVQYLKDVNVLFLGGLTVAVAVEHWNLHKRIALKVLTLMGAKPRWLLFGFMVTTAFLSMWISNVATTAMMIPIAQAVLDEIGHQAPSNKENRDSGCNTPDEEMGNGSPGASMEPYSGQDTPLGAEMGNIGEARELGKRLASYDESEVPKWAHNEPTNNRYSKGVVYSAVSVGNHSPEAQAHIPPMTLTVPDEDDGPDTSTTQLMPQSIPTLDESKMVTKKNEGMCKALTISICYAANIGGTATLTGTGPNLIMAGQFKSTYPAAPEIDFGSWAMYAFPGMVVFLIFAWMWLQYLFLDMRLKDIFSCCKNQVKTMEEQLAERVIARQYRDLGCMSFAEKSVLALFIILALLWLTRAPGFIPGWGTLPIFKPKYITDATVAMLISFILFVFPSRRPNILFCRPKGSEEQGPVPPLLTWPIVQQKMAWNVILLLGGGFAMALGSKESRLSAWIGTQLEPLNQVPPYGAAFICCIVICALTQCTSNTATATVFIPILAELAEVLHVNPLYFLLPATVTTSFAFMLPVSTPPNAIAYSYGHLKMMDMIKAGFLLNIFGIFIVISSVYIMGGPSFGVFKACPDWLHSEICNEIRNRTVFNATLSMTTEASVANVTSLLAN